MTTVCTTIVRIRRTALGCSLSLALVLSLIACGGSASSAEPSQPIAAPAVVTTPTATPQAEATPTQAPALDALLEPGPTAPAPATIFFANGADLWALPADGVAFQVTNDLRIGPWTQTIDGARVAAVVSSDVEGQSMEEIRLIAADGTLSEPVYGPVPITGGDATARIRDMDWSWDGKALAVAFAGGRVISLTFAEDPVAPPSLAEIATPHAAQGIAAITWIPSGRGVTYLAGADRATMLYVTPEGQPGHPVIDPPHGEAAPVRSFAWLPGRGRLAFVEDSDSSVARRPSSIFTVALDGASPQLLLSAGQFAPAASILDLRASPNGVDLAFTVAVPDHEGRLAFDSLWVLNIDSGELAQAPLEPGYRVTDLWWTSSGLVWRGVEPASRTSTGTLDTDESQSFILGRFDPAARISTIVFQPAP